MNDIQLFRQLVSCNDGQPVTTSRKIADAFGKRHSDVLRAITNLECSDSFRNRNFALTHFETIMPNGATRHDKEFTLSRDGATFLLMGFGGKKASQFKESYIAAFNWMADNLQKRRELDLELGDFSRREALSVSDGSFHGRGLAQRKIDKASLSEELASISSRLQMALELIEQ